MIRYQLLAILVGLCAPIAAGAQAPAGFDRAWQSLATA